MAVKKIINYILLIILVLLLSQLIVYYIFPPRIPLVFSKGDTIYEFAQLLEIDPIYLMKYNNIKSPRGIPVGKKIYSPPLPVKEYLKYRLGFKGKYKGKTNKKIKPLIYDDTREVTGTIFFEELITESPDPQVYCGDHMIIGHLFLEDEILFDFVQKGNRLRMYELAGNNPILCDVKKINKNNYMIPEAHAAEFWSLWNNFKLYNKKIVFYKGEQNE